MSEFNTFTFFSIFITLYFVFMVPLGGAEIFTGQSFNVSQQDLSVSPSTPQDRQEVDIGFINGTDSTQNLNVVEVSNLSSPDFNTDYAFELDNSSEAGFVFYSVPSSVQSVDMKTSKVTPLIGFTDIDYAEYSTTNPSDFENDAERIGGVAGESDFNLLDDTNYVGLRIGANSDQKIYDVSFKDAPTTQGFFGRISSWFASAFSSIAALGAVVTQLPWFLAIPFGLYISYLLIKVLSLL